MTPEQLARAFKPFHTTKAQGLGVGLPLAKRIIERMGGSISLIECARRGNERRGHAAGERRVSYAVLIVEDEAALARNICDLPVQLAATRRRQPGRPRQALQELETFKPDVVLLDFNLPGVDGLKALGLMREIDPQIQVVMITGHASVELAVDAMKAGAYDFLTKPVSLSKLRIVLDKLTQSRSSPRRWPTTARAMRTQSGLDKLVGECAAMQQLRDKMRQVIRGDESCATASPRPC